MRSNLQVHDVVVAEVQTGALCALCLNPKNPLAGKFHVGASPAREWKEQSHAGRAPTIEESSIGQSGLMVKDSSVLLKISMPHLPSWSLLKWALAVSMASLFPLAYGGFSNLLE